VQSACEEYTGSLLTEVTIYTLSLNTGDTILKKHWLAKSWLKKPRPYTKLKSVEMQLL
jgi:hypothetical protein